MEKSKYKCPWCDAGLTFVKGTQMNPQDGITVYCGNMECEVIEISGHGKNEDSAYNIILEKYPNGPFHPKKIGQKSKSKDLMEILKSK